MRIIKRINEEKLKQNLDIIKERLKDGVGIIAVVKSNAYGNGDVLVSRVIERDVQMFAVSNVQEALRLKQGGITKDILILGHVEEEYITEILKHDFIQTIASIEKAENIEQVLSDVHGKMRVHIKVNTGMNRNGFNYKLPEKILDLKKLAHIKVEGIYSHLAYGDCLEFSKKQESRFDELLEHLKKENFEVGVRHLLNSAGIFNADLKQYDAVRPGISLYGYYPNKEVKVKEKAKKGKMLRPVLSIESEIKFVRRISQTGIVSYDGRFVAPCDMTIGVVPVGYDDGYSRAFSNKANVIIKGVKCKVLGSICMNAFMVDLTKVLEKGEKVKVGDKVTLLGEEGRVRITADDLAKIARTISYEILCNFKF